MTKTDLRPCRTCGHRRATHAHYSRASALWCAMCPCPRFRRFRLLPW